MLTILLTTVLALLSPASAVSEAMTVAARNGQSMQQPQPRRSSRQADKAKPAPDTTRTKKGRPERPASVDSLRRGGATRVDTVQA